MRARSRRAAPAVPVPRVRLFATSARAFNAVTPPFHALTLLLRRYAMLPQRVSRPTCQSARDGRMLRQRERINANSGADFTLPPPPPIRLRDAAADHHRARRPLAFAARRLHAAPASVCRECVCPQRHISMLARHAAPPAHGVCQRPADARGTALICFDASEQTPANTPCAPAPVAAAMRRRRS